MEFPKYNATCHPNEYIKQMTAHCKINKITNEQEILEFCKLMIDSTITLPNEINSLNELVMTLKSHLTFNIFKNTCKEKLKFLKYVSEKKGGNTCAFLSNFRSLCNDAEINDSEEIKNLLFKTLPPLNDFCKMEFKKRIDGIDSMDEILKVFSDVVFDELNVIEYDSLIALKHVATGKYLSTCKKDKSIAVYAGDKLPNSNTIWLAKTKHSPSTDINKLPYQSNKIFYNDTLYLYNGDYKDYRLYIDDNKSPITGHAEVSINNASVEKFSRLFKDDYAIRFIKSNSTHNNDYVKTKDIIKLQFLQTGCLLRSHDSTFMIGNKLFQEVIGHRERAGGNDKWIIELI
ncbi:hypothetical protein C1645_475514, partial [Glomus cerebriforme]